MDTGYQNTGYTKSHLSEIKVSIFRPTRLWGTGGPWGPGGGRGGLGGPRVTTGNLGGAWGTVGAAGDLGDRGGPGVGDFFQNGLTLKIRTEFSKNKGNGLIPIKIGFTEAEIYNLMSFCWNF